MPDEEPQAPPPDPPPEPPPSNDGGNGDIVDVSPFRQLPEDVFQGEDRTPGVWTVDIDDGGE